jgi:hypothetical protein
MGPRTKQKKQIADLIRIRKNRDTRRRMPVPEELDLPRREAEVIAGIDDEQKSLILRQQAQHEPVDPAGRGDDAEIGVAQDRGEAFLE